MLLFPFFALLLSQVFAKEFSWMKYFAPDAPIKRGFFEERRSAGKFRAFENLFFFPYFFFKSSFETKKGFIPSIVENFYKNVKSANNNDAVEY